MITAIQDISDFPFSKTDKLFLDTNIWYMIEGPDPDIYDRRLHIYSEALEKMVAAECSLFIDPLVLSEFANRYARFRYKILEPDGENYKRFRQSDQFPTVAEDIAFAIRRILSYVETLDCPLSEIDGELLLEAFKTGFHDFNDLLIAETCRINGLTLITDDGDFNRGDLSILTANSSLIRRQA